MTKSLNALNFLLIILTITGITFLGLAATGVFNSPSKSNKTPPPDTQPYIDPQPFKTGYLTNTPQPLADVCNSTMYPVQPLYVNYGNPTHDYRGGECAVNIFNSIP
jgi:hypothetical protein